MQADQRLEIENWIISEAIGGGSIQRLLDGFCRRLADAGFRLWRANISQPTLHPIIEGYLYIWRKDVEEVEEGGWLRGEADATENELDGIPFAYMWRHDVMRLRERLWESDQPTRFPLLNDFRAQGASDYYALQIRFGEEARPGPTNRLISSWVTDRPEGFTEAEIAALDALFPALALAVNRSANQRAFESVVTAYLGRAAGRRVMTGSVNRGGGETLRAVLWYCDLRGFTKISDSQPRDRLLGMMHDYFECMVNTVHEFDGEVLKFTGDGFLAMFSEAEDDEANCCAALNAAAAMTERCDALRDDRERKGLPWADFGLGLHLGEVEFGNIGSRDRLDFTVVGPAVNEVARIEAMSRALDQNVVVSAAFAQAAG
ncbi:MAG: adenylate/guanylate cyclase domain-containing protein, partial [Kiloniellales bacterium]|nr:adenylate/guanylate cyclase domain-containing protein [Kiloniellales bacterium]